jgi:hypothetical protein
MRRYGKFVDARWIQQRMNAKDARFARDLAARVARDRARREWQLVAEIAPSFPAGTDLQTIIDAARAALAKAGAQ